jgi:adenine-specific DNA-methyltransferase
LREIHSQGGFKTGRVDVVRGQFPFYYLSSGAFEKIAKGEIVVTGRGSQGELEIEYALGAKSAMPRSVWNQTAHDAGSHGTNVVKALVPGRAFPFPKSLYAVEDALSFFLRDVPDAIVLDFFGGSGTTTQATMRLNHQDGGTRRSILVTNNEVGDAEAKSLTEQGYRDGDPEWEALGIFECITRPRITAAVTGLTPDGTPIKGDYKFTDEFPMAEGFEENVEFMKLTYLDPVDVELDRAFAAVAPLLWMRAGGQGAMIEQRTDNAGELLPFAVADRYGVLFDPDRWREFVEVLPPTAGTVFVVTDSAAVFAGVAENLPTDLQAVRLYENYLTTFAINRGRGA